MAADNVLEAVERLAASTPREQWPKVCPVCGTEDFLYEDNVKFQAFVQEKGVPVDSVESPGGHDWALWDAQIARVLAWLPLSEAVTRTSAIAE